MSGFKVVVVISLVVATMLGVVIIKIALDHNPMDAYVERDDLGHIAWVDWSYLLLLFGSWFIPVFGICVAIGSVPLIVLRLIQRRSGSTVEAKHKTNRK